MSTAEQPSSYWEGWRNAEIGWPSMLALLAGVAVLGLAGASVGNGSWIGIAVIVAVILAAGLLIWKWSALGTQQATSSTQHSDDLNQPSGRQSNPRL